MRDTIRIWVLKMRIRLLRARIGLVEAQIRRKKRQIEVLQKGDRACRGR